MEKRIHLYINKKSPLLWLMLLCLLASAVLRTVVFLRAEPMRFGCQILIPVIATVWFALVALLSGEEMLFKTAIPMWLLGIGYGLRLYHVLQDAPFLFGALCVCMIFFCVVYTSIISGRIRWPWLLVPMFIVALSAAGYVHRWLWTQQLPTRALWFILPEYLLIAGCLVLTLGIRVHSDERYHPTWGDRSEGRRVRSVPPITQVTPYIMVNRNGASNLFAESIEITQVDRYIRRKRREGMTGMGLTHVIIAAYVRTIAKYPALNRFIGGQKIYSRGDDIALSMVIKKDMSLTAPDTTIKVHLHPADTLEDVFRKFNAKVEEAKNTPLDSDMDQTAAVLSLIPGVCLKFAVWLLKTLDYFGKLPPFLLEVSPFHGSAFFTSMGSLGIRPIYHHLYDFGTNPVFCAFGRKRHAEEIVNGEIVERKYIDLKFTLDERTCDGYYYASALKYFVRVLKHPELLDQPPEKVEQDIP